MTTPKLTPPGSWFHDANFRTLLAVIQLAVLVFGGGVAYSSIRSEQSFLRGELVRIEREANEERVNAAAREIRLRAVEVSGSRTDERMVSLVQGMSRIESQLDRLINDRQDNPDR